MSNKNFNHNDHESFMEGIYGCLERIETGIIELQKSKPSDSNSVVDNEANETLVEEIKALVVNATGLIADILTVNLKSRQRPSIQISVPLARVLGM